MIDRKRDNFHPVPLVDNAILFELLDCRRNSFRRELFILDANLDVQRIGPLQIGHQLLCADGADDAKWRSPSSWASNHPSGHPYVRNPCCVIRMVMGDEECIDLSDRHVDLPQSDRSTAPCIEQKLLAADFDQRARTKSVRQGYRRASAKQCDL